jgi:hypothetical protein
VNQISDAILLQSLEQLQDGYPVESILARFSRHAGELRPILESASRLQGLSVDPSPAIQQHAKADFLAQAAAQAEGAATRWTWPAFRSRWFVPAVAVVLLLLFVGAMIVPASASAIPGDMLYGTKRTVEQWRLWIAGGPEEKAQLAESFRQERIREVAQLFGTTRNAQVSFEGMLQSLTGQQWMVEGLPVLVDSTTTIGGSPAVGMDVRVIGGIQDGQLLASEIRVLGRDIDSDDDNPFGGVLDDNDPDDDVDYDLDEDDDDLDHDLDEDDDDLDYDLDEDDDDLDEDDDDLDHDSDEDYDDLDEDDYDLDHDSDEDDDDLDKDNDDLDHDSDEDHNDRDRDSDENDYDLDYDLDEDHDDDD